MNKPLIEFMSSNGAIYTGNTRDDIVCDMVQGIVRNSVSSQKNLEQDLREFIKPYLKDGE